MKNSYESTELKEFIKKVNLIFKNLKNLITPLNLECHVREPESVVMQTPLPVFTDNSQLHPLVLWS